MMAFFIWFLKIVAVLALAIAGVVAGSFFIVDGVYDPYRFFGDVVSGFGVIGSTLLLGALAWLISAWGVVGRTRVVASVMSVLLVVSACLLNPFASLKDVDPSPTIAWINPFEFFAESSIVGRPSGAMASFLNQRAEIQATTGKAEVVAAFNYKIEKARGWDYGGLALIPQVSANEGEYQRFKAAGLASSFVGLEKSADDPVRLAWVHLAVPTLGNIAMDAGKTRLKPPAFKVGHDFEFALKTLEPVKELKEIAPLYAEVRSRACKEKSIFCDGLFDVRQAGRSALVNDLNHADEAQTLALAVGYSAALLEAVIEEKHSSNLSDKVTDKLPLKAPVPLSASDREILRRLTETAERVGKKMPLLGFEASDATTPPQVAYVAGKFKALQAASSEAEKVLALFNFYETFVVRVRK